tara:strand:- start:475 stop:789 length:315 start_codon:yes stop_codon:yes gene_type:complete
MKTETTLAIDVPWKRIRNHFFSSHSLIRILTAYISDWNRENKFQGISRFFTAFFLVCEKNAVKFMVILDIFFPKTQLILKLTFFNFGFGLSKSGAEKKNADFLF